MLLNDSKIGLMVLRHAKIGLNHGSKSMNNYKILPKLLETNLKVNCIKNWNNLPLELKTLPYSSSKHELYTILKKFH